MKTDKDDEIIDRIAQAMLDAAASKGKDGYARHFMAATMRIYQSLALITKLTPEFIELGFKMAMNDYIKSFETKYGTSKP